MTFTHSTDAVVDEYSAAYWVTDEILYAVLSRDYQRGIDILRFTDKPVAGTTRVAGAAAPAVAVSSPVARPAAPARPQLDPREGYVCPLPGG